MCFEIGPSQSSKLRYDRRSVGQSVLVSSPHLGPKKNCYYCQTFTGLLMWGGLSDERTGLSFTVAAGPRQSSHSLVRVLSQTRDSANLEGQTTVFVSPRTWWPGYTSRHWVPFSSPSTARRATVEVFEPASTRGYGASLESESGSELLYDWRFTANHFVLAPSPLRIMTRDFLAITYQWIFLWLHESWFEQIYHNMHIYI
jgi:hypothetical protein